MAHPQYSVGHNGLRPVQIPMAWTEPTAAPNMQQGPSQVPVTHDQAIQAARDYSAVQARIAAQYNSTVNAPSIPRGSSSTPQSNTRTKMYNMQVNFSAQLQAAHSRLRTTQSQLEATQSKLEAAQAETRRGMVVMQALQARINELEEVIRRKDDAAELQRKECTANEASGLSEEGESRPMPIAKHSSESNHDEGSRCVEEMTSSASESSTSSIGTPGPTIFDDSSVRSNGINMKDSGVSLTPLTTPQIFTPQSTGSDELNAFGAKSKPSVSSNAEPVLRSEGSSKRSAQYNPTTTVGSLNTSLKFHARLLELFHMTASFAQTYTNKPNSLTDGTTDINCIMDLTMTKDRNIVDALMSKQDTRCGLVERIINQFMTRHILFYEVVRGFNSTADSEIRQFLEILYSDTPGLVRNLFYTHLANQVLSLLSQPSFSSQFQMRQSVNANSLYSIISPFLQDSPALAPTSNKQNMRSDFLSIIQTSHSLGLDMISGAYEFNPFWPIVGEPFDPAWMVNRDAGIIGHKIKAKKDGTVKLATSPGIWFADYTKGNGDRQLEMIVSANVLLQKNERCHM